MIRNSFLQFLETTNDAAFLINSKGIIIELNSAACTMFKYGKTDLQGQNIKVITPSPIREKHDGFLSSFNPQVGISHVLGSSKLLYGERSDGSQFPVEVGISFYEENDEKFFVGLIRDQTEKLNQLQEIKFLAEHDDLTQLLNRTTFSQKIEHIESLGFVLIHVHGLNELNHNYGLELTDQLLLQFSNGLKQTGDEMDIFARISSNQFAVAHSGPLDTLIDEINSFVACPLNFVQQSITLKCRLGAACTSETTTASEAFANAEKALRAARNTSANHCIFFGSDLVQRFERERLLIEEIPHAFQRHEFSLVFQPKIRSDNRRATGAEALIRWESSKFGTVSPGEFIPLAEKSGFIADLDGWVFKETVKYISELKEKGITGVQIAVNLSALNLSDSNLSHKMKAVLEKHQVTPDQLNIEITETAIGESIDITSQRLDEIKSVGFSISIDDFGTGYSSMSYLADFPFDYLKVDQSFVSKLPNDQQALTITKSIINLSKGLGLKTIVEGVETKEQADLLVLLGVDIFQGYYFAKPLSKSNFEDFVCLNCGKPLVL
jgi:PAS domain S-box-containing protein